MKPAFSNTGATCECIRDSEGPMKLKLAAWVNPHKDDANDQDKIAICQQITQMIADHRLSFGIKIEHMPTQDYNQNYQIGRMNLFANTERPAEAAAPAPAPAPVPAPAPAAAPVAPAPAAAPAAPTPVVPLVPPAPGG